jgi:hypothetical protein
MKFSCALFSNQQKKQPSRSELITLIQINSQNMAYAFIKSIAEA